MVALALHADYACGRTGVCCSSGWPIPVEAARLPGLVEALGDGRLDLGRTAGRGLPAATLLPAGPPLPEGAAARLGHDADGRCLFLETRDRGLCSVHRQLGPSALPPACRQFPRLAVIEEDRVAVSLSHYCPTAAGLLRADRAPTRVRNPAAFPAGTAWEGLDARVTGSRLLRPGVLLDVTAREEWERRGLETLSAGGDPDVAVGRLVAAAESARTWRAGKAALARHVADAFAAEAAPAPTWQRRLENAERVRRAAPSAWRPPAAWPSESAFETGVRPGWRREARLVGRYLAARFFACWALYQGGGLRSHAAWVRLALDTLAVEAARRAETAAGALAADDLVEAVRETDRRLLHLAAPDVLARGLEASGTDGVGAIR